MHVQHLFTVVHIFWLVLIGGNTRFKRLAIANKLAGSPVRVHAISVSDHKGYFHGHVNDTLSELGLSSSGTTSATSGGVSGGGSARCDGSGDDWRSEDMLHVVDGYKGTGYVQTYSTLYESYVCGT